jgi:ribosomal protein L40E
VETTDGLYNKNFDPPAEQGDWQAVTVQVESYDPHRIEYYQPLTRDGNKRQFKYQWFGDYYAKQFAVSILVPADSTELITAPILQSTQATADGRGITGTVIKNDLRMGNSFQFELEYQRTSDALTDSSQADQIQPAEPVGPDTAGRVSIANLPWIIGGFGLALIGIALFSYWRSTQSSESKPRRRHRRTEEEGDEQAYCHECGARANPGDRFCRTCGSRLRTE